MRNGADDWQTMCGWRVHVWMTCRWCTCLRMMCGQCADDICHPPAQISNKVSLSCHPHVVPTSSACCLHVIRTSSARCTHETSVPRLFQVKQQRTALLKNNKNFGIKLDIEDYNFFQTFLTEWRYNFCTNRQWIRLNIVQINLDVVKYWTFKR